MQTSTPEALVASARQLNRTGLNQGRSGNLSVRHGSGLLITASGTSFDEITVNDVVETDLQGHWSGALKPSSELSFHCGIYRNRPDVGAVVHLHSPWATSLACMHRAIPAFHYMVAVAGGEDIPCVPYATFGTDALAAHVTDGLRERQACLLANHGQIAVGGDLGAAMELAAEVENLARCYGQILGMGEPVLLSREQMAEVLEKFGGYGKPQAPGR
ncbi:MAG: class II aldolase/adducin family protein [Pseudomonadota bacterium]